MTMDHFVWLDIETTGLNVDKDIILEVAFMVTDDCHHIIETYEDVILPLDFAPLCTMDPYVNAMHTNSGLIEACYNGTKTIEDIDNETSEILSRFKKYDDYNLYLAGSSIHFDRIFIKKYMPKTEKLLHYRMLDISAVIMALPDVWEQVPESIKNNKAKHRAMSDIIGSIDKLHAMKNVINKLLILPERI